MLGERWEQKTYHEGVLRERGEQKTYHEGVLGERGEQKTYQEGLLGERGNRRHTMIATSFDSFCCNHTNMMFFAYLVIIKYSKTFNYTYSDYFFII